jgi:hypothetical protein
VYQQTHPVLFSDRALYVVVFSLRSHSVRLEVERHVLNIAVRCPRAPIVVVGTHVDAVAVGSEGLSLEGIKERFPQVG